MQRRNVIMAGPRIEAGGVQLIETLEYVECGVLRRAIGQAIDVAPLNLDIGPHGNLEPLQEPVVGTVALYGPRDVGPELPWLNRPDYG